MPSVSLQSLEGESLNEARTELWIFTQISILKNIVKKIDFTFVAVFQIWVGSAKGIARNLQSQFIPVRFLVWYFLENSRGLDYSPDFIFLESFPLLFKPVYMNAIFPFL